MEGQILLAKKRAKGRDHGGFDEKSWHRGGNSQDGSDGNVGVHAKIRGTMFDNTEAVHGAPRTISWILDYNFIDNLATRLVDKKEERLNYQRGYIKVVKVYILGSLIMQQDHMSRIRDVITALSNVQIHEALINQMEPSKDKGNGKDVDDLTTWRRTYHWVISCTT